MTTLYLRPLILLVCLTLGFAHYCMTQDDEANLHSNVIKSERVDTILVNKNLPKLRLQTIITEGIDWWIDVSKLGTTDTLQRIRGKSYEELLSNDYLRFADANFDGYVDIMIHTNTSANGMVEAYDFYLFDPQNIRFAYNEEFSEQFGANPDIDPVNKQIRTGGANGCIGMCYGWQTYELIDGRMTLIEEETQDLAEAPTDSTGPIFLRTLERLVSGEWTVVQQVKGTIDQIEEAWKE